jgi:hypothetical protein
VRSESFIHFNGVTTMETLCLVGLPIRITLIG